MISTFGAPVGGRNGVIGGNFVSGSFASYVVNEIGLRSGIGSTERCSESFEAMICVLSESHLENHFQARAWNNRPVHQWSYASYDLEVTRQPEPRSDVKVVKHFNLVFGLQIPPAKSDQVDVVFENLAQVRVRVFNSELILPPFCDQTIATKSDIEESGDRTRVFIGKRQLREETPTISMASLNYVLAKGITG
jgi:hypothetical protein